MLVCAICVIAVQSEGGTPLFLASQEGRVGVVRALVGAGAIVDQSTVRYRGLDPVGWSERVVPLPWTAKCGGCVWLLHVRHHPAAYCLYASDSGQSDCWTPLCTACEEGFVEVVMALVGAGAALHHTTVRHRGQGRRGAISLQTVSCGYFSCVAGSCMSPCRVRVKRLCALPVGTATLMLYGLW